MCSKNVVNKDWCLKEQGYQHFIYLSKELEIFTKETLKKAFLLCYIFDTNVSKLAYTDLTVNILTVMFKAVFLVHQYHTFWRSS